MDSFFSLYGENGADFRGGDKEMRYVGFGRMVNLLELAELMSDAFHSIK